MTQGSEREKFHGRVKGGHRACSHPGCTLVGEFRAPGVQAPGFDGPGQYRWFCLDHIRAFNARYDWFSGMSREEIEAAQMPAAGWERATRAFRPTAGVDEPPRWADFSDPLEAISARFRARAADRGSAGPSLTAEERRALAELGLAADADAKALRTRYTELLRRYHPDRNGGDRRHEKKLQAVVEAYQLLRASSWAKRSS